MRDRKLVAIPLVGIVLLLAFCGAAPVQGSGGLTQEELEAKGVSFDKYFGEVTVNCKEYYVGYTEVTYEGINCLFLVVYDDANKIFVSNEAYLFDIDIDAELEDDLNDGVISKKLKDEFETNGITLSESAAVNKKDAEWVITDAQGEFAARKEGEQLKIYDQKIVEKVAYVVVADNHLKGLAQDAREQAEKLDIECQKLGESLTESLVADVSGACLVWGAGAVVQIGWSLVTEGTPLGISLDPTGTGLAEYVGAVPSLLPSPADPFKSLAEMYGLTSVKLLLALMYYGEAKKEAASAYLAVPDWPDETIIRDYSEVLTKVDKLEEGLNQLKTAYENIAISHSILFGQDGYIEMPIHQKLKESELFHEENGEWYSKVHSYWVPEWASYIRVFTPEINPFMVGRWHERLHDIYITSPINQLFWTEQASPNFPATSQMAKKIDNPTSGWWKLDFSCGELDEKELKNRDFEYTFCIGVEEETYEEKFCLPVTYALGVLQLAEAYCKSELVYVVKTAIEITEAPETTLINKPVKIVIQYIVSGRLANLSCKLIDPKTKEEKFSKVLLPDPEADEPEPAYTGPGAEEMTITLVWDEEGEYEFHVLLTDPDDAAKVLASDSVEIKFTSRSPMLYSASYGAWQDGYIFDTDEITLEFLSWDDGGVDKINCWLQYLIQDTKPEDADWGSWPEQANTTPGDPKTLKLKDVQGEEHSVEFAVHTYKIPVADFGPKADGTKRLWYRVKLDDADEGSLATVEELHIDKPLKDDDTEPPDITISILPEREHFAYALKIEVTDLSGISNAKIGYVIKDTEPAEIKESEVTWLLEKLDQTYEYGFEVTDYIQYGAGSETKWVALKVWAWDDDNDGWTGDISSTSKTLSVKIPDDDAQGPTIGEPVYPAQIDYNEEIEVTSQVADGSGLSSVSLYYSYDKGGWTSLSPASHVEERYTFIIPAPGEDRVGETLYFYLEAIDNDNDRTGDEIVSILNNWGDYYQVWIIDTIPPRVRVLAPPIARGQEMINAWIEGEYATVSIKIDGKEVSTGLSYDWDTTACADGDYTITIEATDSFGNVGSDSKTVSVDNTPPVINIVNASAESPLYARAGELIEVEYSYIARHTLAT
ncbi:MAG TPA: hypothetical protein G4O03_01005 [Dehalococcoidia bacterium]|nr:hypothetical protein [Dehalococcoidia bacterium]